jgi:phosphoglycolate phosphatase-like HAD superfamily hydrolase
VLFDVDGTLFLTDDPLFGRSAIETLEEIYDLALPEDAIQHVDHAGQTSKRIARLVLSGAGLDDRSIDAHIDAWCACSAERYIELLASSTAGWRARPGSAKALTVLADRGMRLALLTGNPEPVARARMERLGLARFFPEAQGAFGCEGERRAELLALARRRAGGSEAWPANRTIEVGDTCRDVESAHAAGIRSVAIASGRVERERLEPADAVIGAMPELTEVLLGWD